jgi:uncharacterized membrane protein
MSEMTTNRLEAFSDGVIAIIITIMVLELRAPATPTLAAAIKVVPVFISYALSFLVAAIMWVNHHHLIHAVHSVTARLLWSNLYLLFWMSLVPFVTDFMGKNYREPMAVALYGLDLFLCATGFYLLRTELVRQSRHDFAMVEYHAGLRFHLRRVLHLRPDPRHVFPAGKEACGRVERSAFHGKGGGSYFLYCVGNGPFSRVSLSQIQPSRV